MGTFWGLTGGEWLVGAFEAGAAVAVVWFTARLLFLERQRQESRLFIIGVTYEPTKPEIVVDVGNRGFHPTSVLGLNVIAHEETGPRNIEVKRLRRWRSADEADVELDVGAGSRLVLWAHIDRPRLRADDAIEVEVEATIGKNAPAVRVKWDSKAKVFRYVHT